MNTPLPTLTELSRVDRQRAASEFVAVAKSLLGAGGSVNAHRYAENANEPRRVVEVLRTAVAAGGLTDSAWGSSLFAPMVAAFAELLKTFGVFDQMLPAMVQVPIGARVAFASVGAAGSVAGEGAAKAVNQLTTVATLLDPQKAAATIVVSEELLRGSPAGLDTWLFNELRAAVAVLTDRQFLATITAGISPSSSSGTTAANVREDLRDLAASISTSVRSRLFLIVSPADAKGLALMGDASGAAAFPLMGTGGGVIGGITVLVSDGVPTATAVLIDASGIGAGSGRVELDTTRNAALEMADFGLTSASMTGSPPTSSTGTTLVSLFQTNSVGLRVERFFGAARLRTDAVAVMTVDYSGVGSPA